MKRTREYLIRRIDHNYFHGWSVAISRRGMRLTKLFSDQPGGRRASFARARRFRDRMLESLPPPTKVKKKFALNTTGVIGVTLARERTRAGTIVFRYRASWPRRDGTRAVTSFSTYSRSKAEARRLAIRAREEGLRREGIVASLEPPADPRWRQRRGR